MLLQTDSADEQGLQVSLRRQLLCWENDRKPEASLSSMSVQPMYTSRNEAGL